jgi:hypothetical protein
MSDVIDLSKDDIDVNNRPPAEAFAALSIFIVIHVKNLGWAPTITTRLSFHP